jgi:hypothetical protein
MTGTKIYAIGMCLGVVLARTVSGHLYSGGDMDPSGREYALKAIASNFGPLTDPRERSTESPVASDLPPSP